MVGKDSYTDEFGDSSAPPIDNDAYSPNSRADLSAPLSAAVPLPVWYDSERIIRRIIRERQEIYQSVLRRPLTKDEAEYTVKSTDPISTSNTDMQKAYWTGNIIQSSANLFPIGMLAGLWRSYNTRTNRRFLLISKPKPIESEYPPSQRLQRLVLWEGRIANATWHSWRGCTYAFTGGFLAFVVAGIYTFNFVMPYMASDPRGKRIREELLDITGGPTNVPRWFHELETIDRYEMMDRYKGPRKECFDNAPPASNAEHNEGTQSVPTAGSSTWDRIRREELSGSRPKSSDNDASAASKSE